MVKWLLWKNICPYFSCYRSRAGYTLYRSSVHHRSNTERQTKTQDSLASIIYSQHPKKANTGTGRHAHSTETPPADQEAIQGRLLLMREEWLVYYHFKKLSAMTEWSKIVFGCINKQSEKEEEHGVTNRGRQNNYTFPYEAVSPSVTATLSQSTSWFVVALSNGCERTGWFTMMVIWTKDMGHLLSFWLWWLVNYVAGFCDYTPRGLTYRH